MFAWSAPLGLVVIHHEHGPPIAVLITSNADFDLDLALSHVSGLSAAEADSKMCLPSRRSGPCEAPASIDHLVGAQQNRWRYRKAQRLGGLAVDYHVEFR